jgi:Holliday junction resolvase RusA-like endonuclease
MKAECATQKEDYQWQAKSQWKHGVTTDQLSIAIRLYFGTKRTADWDNFHKLSMDALTGIVWEDDSQIKRATVDVLYDKKNPRIEIDIHERTQEHKTK